LQPLVTNQLVISGEVVQIETLRYTPAGIPLLSFVLRHLSEQGELAEKSQHIKVGTHLNVTGFIAKRSLKSTQLVLHINTLNY
jgi:primosomal replication protein N